MVVLSPKEVAIRRASLETDGSDTSHHVIPTTNDNQFHPFLRLPIELRDMIWTDHLPGPRTITIVRGDRAQAKSGPVPKLLHVCIDSRRFAMQYYSLGFGSQLHGRPVYFDYKRDLLYIAHRGSMEAFYGSFSLKERPDTLHEMDEVEALVQRLGINTTCLSSPTLPMLSRFRNLKVLRLTSISKDPANRLTPHSEKLLLRNLKKNAKKVDDKSRFLEWNSDQLSQTSRQCHQHPLESWSDSASNPRQQGHERMDG